jgi:hypothetical protein
MIPDSLLTIPANWTTCPIPSRSTADSYCECHPDGKNDAFKAVLPRVDIFSFDASQEEVSELMRWVASTGFESVSPNDCLEVADFIEPNGDDRAISMRLLEPSFRTVLTVD